MEDFVPGPILPRGFAAPTPMDTQTATPARPRLLHAMVRVRDPERSLAFFALLGLSVVRRKDYPEGRFTLIYLSDGTNPFEIELTHNWDRTEDYGIGDAFGHIAIGVPDIFAMCESLESAGALVARPPRDGHMAFIKTPDGLSIELLQQGPALPVPAAWAQRPNVGRW